jgi:hypothetical protein
MAPMFARLSSGRLSQYCNETASHMYCHEKIGRILAPFVLYKITTQINYLSLKCNKFAPYKYDESPKFNAIPPYQLFNGKG